MASKIIILCGAKRAGKDTVADILCSQFEYRKLRIADPLKRICKDVFGFTEEQVEGNSKEVLDPRYNVTPRYIMQVFGTELMQLKLQEYVPSVGRLIWMRKLLADIQCTLEEGKGVVISDLRFIHEFDSIRSAYPKDCQLVRVTHAVADTAASKDAHVSEHEWKQIRPDKVIHNGGTLEDLKALVVAAFTPLP